MEHSSLATLPTTWLTGVPPPDMEGSPSQNQAAWGIWFDGIGASVCQSLTNKGLYSKGITMTNARFAKTHPNEARWVLGNPPDKKKFTDMKLFELCRDDHKMLVEGIATLKIQALASVGETIRLELYDAATGHMEVSVTDIVQHVWETYGLKTKADIHQLNKLLTVPFSASKSFSAQATRMNMIFTQLDNIESAGKNEFDKVDALCNATSAIPAIVKIIALYDDSELDVTKRTFDAICKFIRQRAPTVTTTAGGFLGHHADKPFIESQPIDAATTYFASLSPAERKAAASAHAANVQSNRNGDRDRGAGRGGGRQGGRGDGRGESKPTADQQTANADEMSCYCFKHGWTEHIGKDCKYMKARNLEQPGYYTSAQMAATGPGKVDGYWGHK